MPALARICPEPISSGQDLVSKCGPLLDRIFERGLVSKRQLAGAMRACHIDISENSAFLLDYVALRSMGVHSQEPLREVPAGRAAPVMADLHLHGEGLAGAQRCAVKPGVVLSYNTVKIFSRLAGKVRVVTMREVQLDDALRVELECILAEHLVARGVHRVCEELLARRKVCLPFAALQKSV